MDAISGFGNFVVIGTNRGRVLIFNSHLSAGGLNWENEAALSGFGPDEESSDPIVQVCCASALGLVLLVVGDELVGLAMDDEFRVSPVCSSVSRCALNSHPTTDDPFSLQLAICHSQKVQILVGRITSSDCEFSRDRKVSLPGSARAAQLAFSGHCLCYATAAGVYFVHNFQRNEGPLKLFDSPATEPRAICTVGLEEFALISGVQGLIVFVNGHGTPSRAPISVGNDNPVVGLTLKEPFLHVLSADGTLSVFSSLDDQIQQTLAFPSDEPPLPNSAYQLANIDGAILVLPPSGNCLFELICVPIISQIEEQLNSGNFDEALDMMDKNPTHFLTSATQEQELVQIRHLRAQLAFSFVQRGDFEKGLDLLTKCEVDPREFLCLVSAQHPQLGLVPSDLPPFPIDGEWPQIPLEIAKQYLELVRPQQWLSSDQRMIVKDALIRCYALMEEWEVIDRLIGENERSWNGAKLREWLIGERKMPNLAAKLAAEADSFEEAFEIWQKMLEEGGKLGEQPLEECRRTLFRVNSFSQMAAALEWLILLDPKVCLDAIEKLDREHPEGKCPAEEVLRLFHQSQNSVLLLRYLEQRVYELDSPPLHDKLLELYVHFIRDNKDGVGHQGMGTAKYRANLRHFLLFSGLYNSDKALALFGNGNTNLFSIEAILVKANDQNAVGCLQSLIGIVGNGQEGHSVSDEDALCAAQLLCTRYPSPEMLTTTLTLNLRLSRSDPTLRDRIPHILELLDKSTSAVEVFRCVPEDLLCAAFVGPFLRRHVAQRLNTTEWQSLRAKLAERERWRTKRELSQRAGGTSFRVDEQTKCNICERRLRASDDFVRHPNNGRLTHLRCHEEDKRKNEQRAATEERGKSEQRAATEGRGKSEQRSESEQRWATEERGKSEQRAAAEERLTEGYLGNEW